MDHRGQGADFLDFLIFVAVLALVVMACAAAQS